MWRTSALFSAGCLLGLLTSSTALDFGKMSPADFTCGKESCYDVLMVTRSASFEEIKRSYRRLAMDWHPDKNKAPDAPVRFKLIALAYEILSVPEKREAHNYYLDHPERFRALFYGLTVVAPAPTSPLVVLLVVLLLVHIGQYFNGKWRYDTAISNIKESQQFKRGVDKELYQSYGKKFNKLRPEEQHAARIKVEKELLDQQVAANGGKPEPFHFSEFLIFKMIKWPPAIFECVVFHVTWFWKFGILRQEYSIIEQEYLTRKAVRATDAQWNALTEGDRRSYLDMALWLPENLKEFKEEQAEREKQAKLNSREFKQWKKWKKKNYDLNPAAEMD